MRALIGLFLIILSSATIAFPSDPANNTDPKFKQAEDYINQKNYSQAIPLLTAVVASDPKNADAYNYLGYSYRQLGKLDDALKYYNMALKIDPNHKGANEYLGELYLMKGDLSKAQKNLEVLQKACPSGCIEYSTLKDKIEAFKKNGNKPAAGGY